MKRREEKPPPRPPTDDDLFLDRLRRECVVALVEALKNYNTARAINTLTVSELACLVEAVTAQWIVSVARCRAEPDKPQALVDALAFLV